MHKDGIIVSIYQLLKRFPDESAARAYIEERRWHGKPICPYCGANHRIQQRKLNSYFRCPSCKKDFTVRVGTIFERSHVPLDKWIFAMYLLVTASKGISSLQLSKEIGVTQKTAWFMLQRLREACGNNEGDLPSGIAVLNRGFYGVYHSFSNKHLHRYVDEFSFRLNEGSCRVHSLERINALVRRTIGVRLTYKALVNAR